MGNESSCLKKITVQSQPFYSSKLWSIHNCSLDLKQLNLFILNDSEYCFDFNVSLFLPFITYSCSLNFSNHIFSSAGRQLDIPTFLNHTIMECIKAKNVLLLNLLNHFLSILTTS